MRAHKFHVSVTNMKSSRQKEAPYKSPVRQLRAELTQKKIRQALLDLFLECGDAESVTYKSAAKRAGVTEMTVYRLFPNRESMMTALWEAASNRISDQMRMPESFEELLIQNPKLHKGFGQHPAIAVSSITTKQGREMRAAVNHLRSQAFLKIVTQLNPTLSKKKKTSFASVLQLLHSAYAWDSLRIHWNMSTEDIVRTTQDFLIAVKDQIKNCKKEEKI